MIDQGDVPDSIVDRGTMMEKMMIDAATGGAIDNPTYPLLRREFVDDPDLKRLLPKFVVSYRDLSTFWPFIRSEAATYAERRRIIANAFTPLIDYLEGARNTPGDLIMSNILRSFDTDGVREVWTKALSRRVSDPAGAITVARTLLETVSKRILEDRGEKYIDSDDLPKLYTRVARALTLAPNQHAEEPVKAILGSAMNLVNGIGTLRNRLSDSHGRGSKMPVRPSPRHASLAVNTAGAIATFLVETHLERQ